MFANRSCEVDCSGSCGVASLSECLVCKSKYLEYSRKDAMHVVVVLVILSMLAMVQSPITILYNLKIAELTLYLCLVQHRIL